VNSLSKEEKKNSKFVIFSKTEWKSHLKEILDETRKETRKETKKRVMLDIKNVMSRNLGSLFRANDISLRTADYLKNSAKNLENSQLSQIFPTRKTISKKSYQVEEDYEGLET
jgi:hypothetical protein